MSELNRRWTDRAGQRVHEPTDVKPGASQVRTIETVMFTLGSCIAVLALILLFAAAA